MFPVDSKRRLAEERQRRCGCAQTDRGQMICLFLIIPLIHKTEIKERDRLQEEEEKSEKKKSLASAKKLVEMLKLHI